ncbi:MAG: peroxiredoxin [Candidatus Zixiibacteriota bacterium]|nr:MAG: peroxiredoxin [candidate division Zixibacteria bacterium]
MTEQAERAKVGDLAKDFVLKDQNEKEFKLSEQKGKRVLLSFHPMAWTGVCAKQMQSLEANKETFDSLNTVAVGLSVDSTPSKKAWADTLGISNTSLLADFWPHGGVAKLYGIFREKNGISERANILVDENGKIAFVKVYPIPELPDMNEIIDFIRSM